jgi:DNA-binding SARP family transcriptional activator
VYRLRLKLLGPPIVEGPQGPIRVQTAKGLALLYFLAAQPGRPVTRSEIAELLWEGTDEASGRHVLTTILSALRRTLPAWPIQATRESLTWDAGAKAEVDLHLFLRWTGLEREVLPPQADPAGLRAAAALWRGPFLQGFHPAPSESYEDWLRQQQVSWERRMLLVLARLAQLAESAARWDEIMALAAQALAIDPFQERFHRWRMMGLAAVGDRAAALAQYDACRAVMQKALGTEPDAATRALRDQIAAASYPPSPEGAAARQRTAPRIRLGPPAELPLVGRTHELGRVCSSLTQVATGAGRVVLVHGEAGIGKTRLVQEVLDGLRVGRLSVPRFATVLTGRCHEALRNLPYAPIIDALHEDAMGVDGAAGACAAHLGAPAKCGGRSQLMHSPSDARSGAGGAPPAEEPSPGPYLMRLLAALPAPILLVLDDLHWADDATLSLFFSLACSSLGQRLCMLVTLRSEDLAFNTLGLLRRLQRDGDLHWIDLGPLSAQDVRHLVQEVTHRTDDALAHRLHAETGGNPLFVVEILRALKETPGWQPGSTVGLPLPPTVQATIRSRVARLGDRAARLLVAVTVAPVAMPYGMLFHLAQLEEEGGVEDLESLLRAHLLVEDKGPSLYPGVPGPHVSFSHELIRRVVREDTSATRWKLLHRRAFAYLLERSEATHGARSLAACLAYHATEGDLWEEGVHWCQRAAAVAEEICAYATAARWLEAAQGNLERLPPSRQRDVVSIDLHLWQALLGWSTTPARAVASVAAAEREAAVLGNRECDPNILTRQAEGFLIGGRLSQVAALLEKLVPLAKRSGNRQLLATALLRLAQLRALQGEFQAAVPPFEESGALLAPMDSPFLHAQSVGTLASTLATLGEFHRARALLQDLHARGQTLNHRSTRILAALHQLTVEVLQECWSGAAVTGRQLLELLHDGHHEAYEYIGLLFLGLPLARLGDPRGGAVLQRRAIAMASRLGIRILLDRAYAYLAEILLTKGELQAAEEAATQGLQIAREDGYRFGAAFNTRVLGQIALASGRREEARRYGAEALGCFARMGARPEMARCHALLAEAASSAAERETHRRWTQELSWVLGPECTPSPGSLPALARFGSDGDEDRDNVLGGTGGLRPTTVIPAFGEQPKDLGLPAGPL